MLEHTKRLHISPLTPETLPIVLRKPLSGFANNISFHSILTFPEKPYGFVTLPVAEAEKLKKKLHGSVLQGVKMRVEDARAKESLEEDHKRRDGEEDKSERRSRRSRKAGGREDAVLPGVKLEEGRKVKRGWTKPSTGDKKELKKRKDGQGARNDDKSLKAGSITGKEECLFKTKLPPNVRHPVRSTKEPEGKALKRKRGQSNGDLVVHEFTNTQKRADFLRHKSDGAGGKAATAYVDGKGWVDEHGNVVEVGPAKNTRRAVKPLADAEAATRAEPTDDGDDATSSSGTSSSEDQENHREENLSIGAQNASDSKPKGLGISSTVERLSITRSSATPPPASADEPIPTLKSPEPHPLETLFKRPSKAASQTPKEKPLLEVSTSFSFSDPDAHELETRLNIPQTPFTQQDIRQRRQRSAAPTPDTAVPGKTFGNVWGGPESSDIASEDDEEKGEDGAKALENMTGAPPEEGEQSEFTKWFYEHRGENNRAWKRRRREAAKEKRQSENRKRRGD